MHVKLSESRLEFSELSARVAGGLLTGSTSLQADQPPPRWSSSLSFANVDLQRWIRGLNKGGSSLPDSSPACLSGTLNAKLSLTGSRNSVAGILSRINGLVQLDLVNGEISQLLTVAIGLDAAQSLGMLIAGDAPLRLNCARAKAGVQDGVIKTRHAVLDNKDSTLHIQGGARLKDETLRFRVVAEPKDFSPLSLRTPLQIAGSFKQPRVTVQTSALLARAAGALIPGALAPPAALLALIDTGAQANSEPCAPVKPKTSRRPRQNDT